MKKLAGFFFRGLLFIIPVGITLYVIYWLFAAIADGMEKLNWEFSPWANALLGVLIGLTAITVVGMLTSFFVTRPLMQFIEKFFTNVPLIKLLYSSIKDLIGAFVGEKKKFNKPVLLAVDPQNNLKALGFITRESLEIFGLADEIAVYLPQSYNFAGSVFVVRRDRVQPLQVDSSEVMTFIVSGGVSGPSAAQGTA